uniref:ubiquitinyl hydrolase 1 n=1 Tax=Meloidogyne incognita TaxID=6306 RepID=A0A914MDZ3_MELIC
MKLANIIPENHPEKSTSSGNEPKSTITATDSSDQNIFEGKFPGLQTPCLQRLKNHGNTDYFSALMHCLSGCDRFAEFILCNDFVEYEENIIFNSFINTIRCMWFNHSYVDTYFHKTIIALASENSTFCLGYQHVNYNTDSHECMVWLLNQLNREIMDSNLEGKSWKGSTVENNKDKISTILELFQGTLPCTAAQFIAAQCTMA